MRLKQALMTIIVAAASVMATLYYVGSKTTDVTSGARETVYDRVMSNNTLRCGYNDWQPFFKKDGADGQPEGFFVDLMEELTRRANLKLEWAAPVDWSTIPTDLGSGKADSFCGPVYANATRARGMLFGSIVGYQYLEPFVRADETRFLGTPEEAFDKPDVTIVGWEGTPSMVQAQLRFKKPKYLAIGLNEATSSGYLAVVNRKADVFFSSMADAHGFMQANPGKIKRLDKGYYLGSVAIAINAPKGEHDLLNLLNTAFNDLRNDGTYIRLYQKYNLQSPGFMEPTE